MKNISKTFIFFILTIFLLQFSTVKLYPGWFKHLGGVASDHGYAIQQTSDGGYIVAGMTNSYSYGNSDIAVYKLNSSGNKVWFKHYGGTNFDDAYSVEQTSDGGYIVAGYTESYSYGASDFAIYKLNSSGNKVWFKHYGGTNNEKAYSIQQTSDGGYIVAGYTHSYSHGESDIAIYKLNSSGNKAWFKHYGGTDFDYGDSVQQISDGGYIVAGSTKSYSYGNSDFAIYKLTSSGNKVWFKHYGGTSEDSAFSIQQTSDGGYIVAGHTHSYTYGVIDFSVYKLNSSGNKVWFRHFGGVNSDYGRSIHQTSDGGYVFAGFGMSFTHGNWDFNIYRLNSSGNKIWFKHYGGSSDDRGRSIQQTSDGGYIVSGYNQSYTHGNYDFAIYKLNSNGNK